MHDAPSVTDDALPEPVPARPRRLVRWAATSLAGLALIYPAARQLARLDWRFDLVTHFYVAAWVASLAAVAALALARRRRLALAFALLAAWQAGTVVRCWLPAPGRPGASEPRLRLLVANVYKYNHDYEAIAALIRRERPDVVGFVEVLRHLAEGMERTDVRDDYPYRYYLPVGGQGLALWFRERPGGCGAASDLRAEGEPGLPGDRPARRPRRPALARPPAQPDRRGP